MKEESKYYIPLPEEFCVGFEYEERVKGYQEDWDKGVIYIHDTSTGCWESNIQDVLMNYDDGCIEYRIKYLDSEDIESLGFLESKYKGINVFRLKHYLLFLFKDCFVSIESLVTDYNELTGYSSQIFRGVIKNKKELELVLKQIGVL